jgi:hypothetical protein
MNTAQKVRLHKESHPELYCSKCLWRTNGGDCPRHAVKVADPVLAILLQFSPEFSALKAGKDDLYIDESPLMTALYEHFTNNGEMPYGTAKARTGDPDQWIFDHIEKYLH